MLLHNIAQKADFLSDVLSQQGEEEEEILKSDC